MVWLWLTFAAAIEIRVEVRDPTGAPMEAAGRIESLAGGIDRVFRIDTRGTYLVASLPEGRYRIEISRPGFAPQSKVIEVRSPRIDARFTLALAPAPPSAVTVAGTTPLSRLDLPLEEIPAPVQAASDIDISNSGALDVADFLNRRVNGVHVNEVQGNPMQPDVNYRGYTASPLLGTPQGVSIYFDGVRWNQPFGDVVSWDLIPRGAISEVALIAGSNPLFGLNTLGGALAMRVRDGRGHPGTSLETGGGSFARKIAGIEHGGSHANGFHWFLTGHLFFEDGWREDSPSNVRQFFGRLGRQGERTSIGGSFAFANNALIGNGLQEMTFLRRDYASVYTKPDITANRSPFVNVTGRHAATSRITLAGNAWFRDLRTRTLNGDINEDSLDQALYQPNATERAALAAAGYSGFPTAGESAANTPFPFWRCIAQSLLRDEPSEKCNGLLNRSATSQRHWGLAGQLSHAASPRRGHNQFTLGGSYDRARLDFAQSTQLGYLNPDRSVTGVPSFADGVTGGEADGEPFDLRVDLGGRVATGSVYATNTLAAGAWSLTVSGRYNRTTTDNRDRIRPASGTGSLTGRHVFGRFNPAAGATFRAAEGVSAYAGYSEGSRAPSSVELGCADPEQPCKLPNAMAADPPLAQVIARTVEAGLRGGDGGGRLRWSAGWFHASNRDDILFAASRRTGFGYFRNFGRTQRRGFEADLASRMSRVVLGAGYTFLDATFRSAEEVGGEANSESHDEIIEISPGDRMPLLPRHVFKAYADVPATSKLLVNLGLVAASGAIARGNENNAHAPDGLLFLGPGEFGGYAVLNLGARYQVHPRAQLFAQVNNLLDRRYHTAAQLGPMGFTDEGTFIARPFPAVDGEFPVRHSTFFAPGAPRGAWVGLRVQF
jgi:outer membrane receptor protein involved in Fe transport